MIISHKLKYVYIGIPRTGSKSVHGWLAENYQGEWHGMHEWQVPTECKDYLVFTVVRNPYDREASSTFAVLWNGEKPDPSKLVPSPTPSPSGVPLGERIREAKLRGNGALLTEECSVPEVGMNQSQFIKKAGVSLVLYHERLPECLRDLPFVHEAELPAMPLALEKGVRPPGTFFDHFTDEDEQVVWAYASEDFEMLGYHRYSSALPDNSPNSLRI